MESTVSLQEPFSYALWPVVVMGVLAVSALVFWTVMWIRRYLQKKNTAPIKVKIRPVDIEKVRQKYISELDAIYDDFMQGRGDIRKAYQSMSTCIRRFVHEVTGIKVQNCTLTDIGTLGMPLLYNLVQEYYAPEFAQRSEGDVINSLNKTRSLIERWR